MNYKIAGGIKKNRVTIIVGLVLWLFINIVLVLPYTCASNAARAAVTATVKSGEATVAKESMNMERFFMVYQQAINPTKAYPYIFSRGIFGTYLRNLGVITVIYLIFFIIGFMRTMPKHQYEDIEHGSSDWSERRRTIQCIK